MKKSENGLSLYPSDLVNHLGCGHLTQLNLAVAEGILDKPKYHDPNADVLRERGLEFEKAYLNYLKENGFIITVPSDENAENGYERTVSDMQKGVDFIYQARLEMDAWGGTADFLKRVDQPSSLGNWSYEVIDTKLARETKAGAILQLCLYSQLIEHIQGVLPEHIHVVAPGDDKFLPTSYRTEDYLAYHRLMQRRLQEQLATKQDIYPEPVSHCDICSWWQICDKRRRTDDHLSLVAGISRSQRAEVEFWGINTMEALARLPIPIVRKPSRGMKETYVKIREQARVQIESRERGELLYEVLEQQPPYFDDAEKQVLTKGLYRLPEPTPGDIFLDFEGDPFIGTSGLEYLTGWLEIESGTPEYHHMWAFEAADEKAAFETFIDIIYKKLGRHPGLHIYHFHHYETSALKRMMGKYTTRENEMDKLLRGQRFVDLHNILKQTLRASVEKYSLKDLEAFYKFHRKTKLREAAQQKRILEHSLELSRHAEIPNQSKEVTQAYNQEDCLSALQMRNWLEEIRDQIIQKGKEISRPPLLSGDVNEEKQVRDQVLKELFDKLLENIQPDPDDRTADENAKWILANLLEYHWREEKSSWWEFYDLMNRSVEELSDARTALGGLTFEDRFEVNVNYVVNSYLFTPQDSEIKQGDIVYDQGELKVGTVTNIDSIAGIVTIKQSLENKDDHPEAVIKKPTRYDTTFAKPGAIRRLAEWISEHGIDAPGPFRAARDLLLQRNPRLLNEKLNQTGPIADVAVRCAAALQESVLPIQGPPGAGKTYTGAQIIIHLVRSGKKVGVTANSHSAIDTLFKEVIKWAGEQKPIICGHKVSDKSQVAFPEIKAITDNKMALGHLEKGKIHVLGGTPIMWANQNFYEKVDFLIIDEAGQLSLADTIAAGQSAKNIILLGDPQQLKQPQKGSHPEGADVSALEHILGEHQTIPPEKGLFLDQTRRMHPSICEYVSELFYERKLQSMQGLERQLLSGDTKYAGAGLYYEQVQHIGNQNFSLEEAERVREIVNDLVQGTVKWTNQKGEIVPIDIKDILIIAPYNAQVGRIREKLPTGALIGTVDKFQGQEAPVVIYSLASSSPEDAPRGMDFLYNANRFNVAISRARSTVIVVASPKLFNPDCRTPVQMKMANAFCRYLEMAKNIE